MTSESPGPATPAWMSDPTIAGLQARHAGLIKAAQESDELVAEAREQLVGAEQRLELRQALAEAIRKEIGENNLLLAIAQGHAPVPSRDQIHVLGDGLGLALGALRIAVPPAGATPEQLTEFAETMRSLYAAASAVAHRADEAAKAASTAEQPVTATGGEPLTPDTPPAAVQVTGSTHCTARTV